MNNIIALQETAPNSWQAKYQGNYGIYSIKIKLNGEQKSNFSCSCPSDYHPCKHIPIIHDAIKRRIAENDKTDKSEEISITRLLNNVSHKELVSFISRQARHNPLLTNTIMLEFADRVDLVNRNKYSLILGGALKKYHIDYESVYDYNEEGVEIDVLDEWFAKARERLAQKQYNEAVLISKACIEEYSTWRESTDCDVLDYIDCRYDDEPFEIIEEAILNPEIDKNALFNYCKEEMQKKKYINSSIYNCFNDLLMHSASTTNGDEFLELQDSLLNKIDKNSSEAQSIIQRKISFYNNNNQMQVVWQLIEDNLQFEGFRLQLTEKKIKEKKYIEAKGLINDLIGCYDSGDFKSCRDYWKDLILDIAQKEKDISTIQKVSFSYLESYFSEKYYRIYKSTFSVAEWASVLESLINHYQKRGRYGSNNVADILVAEKDEARLKEYIKNDLSVENLEKYYSKFVSSFPEETLALFRQAIDQYADKNTGRTYYEHIVKLLKRMEKIDGGEIVVVDMVNQYRTLYKNRKAMIDVLNKW